MGVDLYIKNRKLDLYPNENIVLNSSITSVSDITQNTTEYTRAFTVPASEINNNIFSHYYDFTINNGFDARVKHNANIDIDGIPFKKGKIRLNSVELRNNKPFSYNINFWGNLVNITDLFGKDKLSDLDLTAFNHEYNSDNVLLGFIGQTSLFSFQELAYGLFSKKQLYYNSSQDNTNTDEIANIHFDASGNNGIKWNDLIPSLKLIEIIKAIEVKYNITFSRDFFARSEFSDLYLLLNNLTEGIGGGVSNPDYTETSGEPYFDLNTNTFTLPSFNTGEWTIKNVVMPSDGFENVEYTVITLINGSEVNRKTTIGDVSFDFEYRHNTQIDFNVNIIIESSQLFSYNLDTNCRIIIPVGAGGGRIEEVFARSLNNTISSEFEVKKSIPDITIIDFFKGIATAHKLVIEPTSENSFYVNDVSSYYATGKTINISDYVDYSKMTISRGNILNPLSFEFKEPKTILQSEYFNNNNEYYGDSLTTLRDANNEVLEGKNFSVKIPFEQVIYERLNDLSNNEQTFLMYGALFDTDRKPVKVSNHVHYLSNLSVPESIGFINDLNEVQEIRRYNVPSKSRFTDNFGEPSFIFDSEVSEWNGNILKNTLYNRYYKDYIESIFNVKRRNTKVTVKDFPLRFLTTLNLNDVLQIKDNFYRIDSFNTNLVTGDVDFNLINSFDNNINKFVASSNNVVTNFEVNRSVVSITNGSSIILAKLDTGDNVQWVNLSNLDSNLFIDTNSENLTGADRSLDIRVTNAKTLQEIIITFTQQKQ